MRNLALAAMWACLALPLGARAESAVDPFLKPAPQGPTESGFSFGARAGFGAPLGKSTRGNDLSSTFSGSIPLQLDAGWRFTPNVYAGLYLQYGPALLDSRLSQSCDGGAVGCSSSDLRIGFDVAYAFRPNTRLAPWLAFGAGFETAKVNLTQGGSSAEFSLKGFELGHLTAGVDLRAWPAVRIGPYASCTLARYTSVDGSFAGVPGGGDIPQQAFHGWLQLGFRAVIDL